MGIVSKDAYYDKDTIQKLAEYSRVHLEVYVDYSVVPCFFTWPPVDVVFGQ